MQPTYLLFFRLFAKCLKIHNSCSFYKCLITHFLWKKQLLASQWTPCYKAKLISSGLELDFSLMSSQRSFSKPWQTVEAPYCLLGRYAALMKHIRGGGTIKSMRCHNVKKKSHHSFFTTEKRGRQSVDSWNPNAPPWICSNIFTYSGNSYTN